MEIKVITMTLGMLVLAASALARPPMLKVFETTYTLKEGSKLDSAKCGICHTKAPILNPYGKDVKTQLSAAKSKILTPKMLKKIDKLDSDKDKSVNIAEIRADTLPGDATSKPAAKGK